MIYVINERSVDTEAYEVRCGGSVVPVEPQVFDLLVLLLENAGRVVSKDEIFERVWNGRIVSDAALSSRIKAARRAIGDDGTKQALIRTVRRRGFRVVAEVARKAGSPGRPTSHGRIEGSARAVGPEMRERIDAGTAPTRPTVAVLPFRCKGEPGAEAIQGVDEGVRSGLARFRTFSVLADSSTDGVDSSSSDAGRIAKAVGARYVVQGSVRESAGRFRIAVELIDDISREVVWSAPFHGVLGDPLETQDEITKAIVGALESALLVAEVSRAKSRSSGSATAYDLVLQAMPMCWALSKTASDVASGLLVKAVEIDANYALGYALLSWCHGQQAVYNWTTVPDVHRQSALAMARRAAHLDNADPLVLNVLASAECVAGDLSAARVHVGRALEIDPNSAWAWIRAGYIHCNVGELDRALADFESALRLSPLDPMRHNALIGMGFTHLLAQHYEEAIAHIEQGLVESPSSVWANRELAAAAAMAGDREKAARSVAIVEGYAPSICVGSIVNAIPIRCDRLRKRFGEALTRAGFRA